MVLIGTRREYVTIQVAADTSDGQGGYTVTWADTYYDWARVKYLNGSRTLDAGGVKYRKAVEFNLRQNDLITEANRLSWDSQYFTIHSVLPDERKKEITVLAYV